MKKPKDIKFVFLLVFLFSVVRTLSINVILKDDSFKVKLKKSLWVLKCGVNYLPQNNNFFYNKSSYYASFMAYEQNFSDAFGPYISCGKINKEGKYFSVYTGISYTHTRFEYKYIHSVANLINYPNYWHRKTSIAEGYIFRNILTAEINFQLDLKNSRFIFSPITPSFVFSSYKLKRKYTEEFDFLMYWDSNGWQHEDRVSEIRTEKENFSFKYPGLSLRFISPVYFGFEQKIRLKRNVILLGIKATILIVRNDDVFYGGQLYTGIEF